MLERRVSLRRELPHSGADVQCGFSLLQRPELQRRHLRERTVVRLDGEHLQHEHPVLQRLDVRERNVQRGADLPQRGEHLQQHHAVLFRPRVQWRRLREHHHLRQSGPELHERSVLRKSHVCLRHLRHPADVQRELRLQPHAAVRSALHVRGQQHGLLRPGARRVRR